jgi:hypothetical protein
VWALTDLDNGEALSRVDPRTNSLATRITLEAPPTALLSASADTVVVVTTGPQGQIILIDAATGRPQHLGDDVSFPQAAAAAGSLLWLSTDAPAIAVFDLRTKREIAAGRSRNEVSHFAAVGDAVWALMGHRVVRLSLKSP